MKRIEFFTLFAAVLISVSCSSNKKSDEKINDMKEFINETTRCTEEFVINIAGSNKDGDIISTIETFRSGITLLGEKSRDMKKKYPDIEVWFNEPPAELADDLDRLHAAEKKFEDTLKSGKVRELRKKNSMVQYAFNNLIKELDSVKFFQD
ncbi:MAG: hypothetical protein FWG49_07645 [Leptospirales bacterium]|nr:hypothetical protein [Leptospirales bacterium]